MATLKPTIDEVDEHCVKFTYGLDHGRGCEPGTQAALCEIAYGD
jgi:hypothetical protein